MKKYLYSKFSDYPRRVLSAHNLFEKLFELIGLYNEFCQDSTYLSFQDYKKKNVGTSGHHYRNIGERIIKVSLENKEEFIPRRVFRYIHTTYSNIQMVAHVDMNKIMTELISFIARTPELAQDFYDLVSERTFSDASDFLYDFLLDYTTTPSMITSIRKHDAFTKLLRNMRENWKQLEQGGG